MTMASEETKPFNLKIDLVLQKLFHTLGLIPIMGELRPGRNSHEFYAELHGWHLEYAFSENFKARAIGSQALSLDTANNLKRNYCHLFTFCNNNEFRIIDEQLSTSNIQVVHIHGQLALYIFVRAIRHLHHEDQPPY